MKSKFRVFGTNVLFEAPFELKASGFSSMFKYEFDRYDFKCEIIVCDKLPRFNGNEVYFSRTQRVLENEYASCRIIIDPLKNREYASSVFSFSDRTLAQVYILNEDAHVLNDIYYLWSIVRPDVICRNSGIFMIHSSYIVDADGKAILFTAPSGVGKSTQARLWHEYGSAKIINGDKAILRCEDNSAVVYGYPVAGTSSICLNETHELKAIVAISQSSENNARLLKNKESFGKLIKNVFIDIWNADDVLAASENLKRVIKRCRVYSFECLPDKSAYDYLNEVINLTEVQP